ncbi:uncharacterized protein LOC125505374 [Dendroctonus ponderosae]|uniref:uncharacterized protein LOC125505374 n=1 Tax=Dendroctonus ponderosae TaxID=77166 RepID=UPI002035AE3E|nr:uncharacterized protein LOC125505374 [Dendroctonus ponderosae]
MSFLLNVPMTVISTVNELLEARFEIGCEDILYNRDFLKYENSSIIREVLNRLQLKNGSGFLKPEKGLAWVKKGQYAFHVELSTAYSIIKDQFDEKTICELKEIPMFPVKQMHANYQKLSPFKDLIDVCLHRLSENGMMSRESVFWHPKKPGCFRSAAVIQINTGLADFYPALCMLSLGMLSSLLILTFEMCLFNVSP